MRKVQSCTKFLVFFYSNTAPRSASHSQSCWTDGYSHGLCCDIGILGPLNKDNTGATEDPANGVSFRGRLGKSMTLKKDPNRTSEEYIVKFEYSIFISLRLMPPAFAGLEIASSMARSTTKSSSNNSTILSIASSMARSTTKSNSNSSNNQQQQ